MIEIGMMTDAANLARGVVAPSRIVRQQRCDGLYGRPDVLKARTRTPRWHDGCPRISAGCATTWG